MAYFLDTVIPDNAVFLFFSKADVLAKAEQFGLFGTMTPVKGYVNKKTGKLVSPYTGLRRRALKKPDHPLSGNLFGHAADEVASSHIQPEKVKAPRKPAAPSPEKLDAFKAKIAHVVAHARVDAQHAPHQKGVYKKLYLGRLETIKNIPDDLLSEARRHIEDLFADKKSQTAPAPAEEQAYRAQLLNVQRRFPDLPQAMQEHRARLLEQARKYDEAQAAKNAATGWNMQDVTPPGYAPEQSSESSWDPLARHLTTEQQKLQASINEAKTILRGKISGPKRRAVEDSLKKTEDRLAEENLKEQIKAKESIKERHAPPSAPKDNASQPVFDSRIDALSSLTADDKVALKKNGKWIAVSGSDVKKMKAEGWVDPSAPNDEEKPMTIRQSLTEVAGKISKDMDFDGLTRMVNNFGLKGLDIDTEMHAKRAISMISHMLHTGRIAGAHGLIVRDKLRGKDVIDMIVQVADNLNNVRDPADAVRKYFGYQADDPENKAPEISAIQTKPKPEAPFQSELKPENKAPEDQVATPKKRGRPAKPKAETNKLGLDSTAVPSRTEPTSNAHSSISRPNTILPPTTPQGKAAQQDAQQHMQAVRAKYQGTDQWLKAPNGQPTKLNERQWLQVRTPEFKQWFGDWENDAKLNLGIDALRQLADGKDEVTIQGIKPELKQFGGDSNIHLVWGDDKKGILHIGKKRGFERVAKVVAAALLGNQFDYAPAKKTVRVTHDGHTAVLSLDEHGKQKTWLLTGWEDGKPDAAGEVSATTGATHHTPTFSRGVMGAGLINSIDQILPRGASKVVDDNGEPLVVYHGTSADFSEFSENAERLPWNADGAGHYFTSSKDSAAGYGDFVMPVFLRAKTPKISENFEHTKVTADQIKKLNGQGFDSIYFSGEYQNSSGKTVQGYDEYVAFAPTQIKSALGNRGRFDAKSPDITKSWPFPKGARFLFYRAAS